MTIELLTCPFCGSAANYVEGFNGAYESRNRIGYIVCDNCACQGEKFAGIDCKEKSVEAWNKRISLDKLACLKKYIEAQALDEGLWFVAETAPEAYLQQELRRVAWLIEEACWEQIMIEFSRLMERV